MKGLRNAFFMPVSWLQQSTGATGLLQMIIWRGWPYFYNIKNIVPLILNVVILERDAQHHGWWTADLHIPGATKIQTENFVTITEFLLLVQNFRPFCSSSWVSITQLLSSSTITTTTTTTTTITTTITITTTTTTMAECSREASERLLKLSKWRKM